MLASPVSRTVLVIALFVVGCSDPPGETPPDSDADGKITVRIEAPELLDRAVPYRLGIAWGQLNDDGPDPEPELVGDQAVPEAAAEFAFTVPATLPSEANLLCERACNDEAMCSCNADSPYRIGIAVIGLVADVDRDGRIDPTASVDVGVRTAWGALIYSEKGGDVLPPSSRDPAQPVLVDGPIGQGITAYEIYSPPTGFDRLRVLPPGGVILLAIEGPNIS